MKAFLKEFGCLCIILVHLFFMTLGVMVGIVWHGFIKGFMGAKDLPEYIIEQAEKKK